MRAIHHCETCDFRLPYCVRTDRRFCGHRCRVWWYRNPGCKRPDLSPRSWGQPQPPGKGQPKTFAEALQALAEARRYAAELEAVMKQRERADQQRHAQLSSLRDAATASNIRLRTERDELKDKLDEAQRQLSKQGDHEQASTAKLRDLHEQMGQLGVRLKRAEASETQAQTKLAETGHQLSMLRQTHAEFAVKHAEETRMRAAREETNSSRYNHLAQQNAALLQSREELHRRAMTAERTLTERDNELKQHRQNLAAAERAHQEVHSIAESTSRSLHIEKERRDAAERRIEQLTHELDRLARESQEMRRPDEQRDLIGMRDNILTAELHEVRLHRDEAIAERERLSARILKLMAPGQYLEHAAAAGYDLTKDPLIRIKREEVLIEHRLAEWQDANKKRRRARRLDPEQTLDEQAYAAALSFRWRHIDHPHLRRKQKPRWIAVGFLLDGDSEAYLLTLARERIEDMRGRLAAG